jgi:plasmid stabilization system protein ParE
MRRIIFAPSFDQEAEDIGVYIEERFGESARRDFVIELSAVCIRLATLPRIGTIKHGYETPSAGFAFGQNWIFFDYDDDEMNFIHILHNRRDKSAIRF